MKSSATLSCSRIGLVSGAAVAAVLVSFMGFPLTAHGQGVSDVRDNKGRFVWDAGHYMTRDRGPGPSLPINVIFLRQTVERATVDNVVRHIDSDFGGWARRAKGTCRTPRYVWYGSLGRTTGTFAAPGDYVSNNDFCGNQRHARLYSDASQKQLWGFSEYGEFVLAQFHKESTLRVKVGSNGIGIETGHQVNESANQSRRNARRAAAVGVGGHHYVRENWGVYEGAPTDFNGVKWDRKIDAIYMQHRP